MIASQRKYMRQKAWLRAGALRLFGRFMAKPSPLKHAKRVHLLRGPKSWAGWFVEGHHRVK